MPYLRAIPILLAALALAASPSSPAQDPATPPPTPDPAAAATAPVAAAPDSAKLAENVLFEAIIKIRARERIAAKIAQDVDMLNQRFRLDGSYYKDTGHRIRLQLDLSGLGDTGAVMLQVCDGKTRWDYQKVLNMQRYTRLEVAPVFKRLEDPNIDDQFRATILSSLGFGGPEALLVGLQKVIGFDQFADETIERVPTFNIGGKWKDRTGLLGMNDRALPPTAPLPPYIPSNVHIFFDKETLWPYRVEMIGEKPSMLVESTQQIGPDGRPVGQKRAAPKVTPSKIVLTYTLLPDSEIKPGEHFAFTGPRDESSVIDETDGFIQQLDRFIQMETARKKADAAKAGDEPAIKGTIDVPAAPGLAPAAGDPAPR